MILDRFVSFDDQKLFLSADAVMGELEPKGMEFLKRAAVPGGALAEVKTVWPIPAWVKEKTGLPLSDGDAYAMQVEPTSVTLFGNSPRAMLYACASFMIHAASGVGCGFAASEPTQSFRMLKLYLPSEENMPFFMELVDTCLCLGYNTIMVETGGAMEYKRHPEINEAWLRYSHTASEHINGRGSNPHFPFKDEETFFEKNSIHCENADQGILSQENVRKLVSYVKGLHMEIIPEVPTLSHSDYLLAAYPEFAERKDDLYPDTYCPSNEDVYPIVFDILDENIDVFGANRLNIGHDEFYSFGLCEKCKNRTPEDIYASDIRKLYDHLLLRGVQTLMWTDKLINAFDKSGNGCGGAEHFVKHPKTGKQVQYIPATYRVLDRIPTNIGLMHWYWPMDPDTEQDFLRRGFRVCFTNFEGYRAHNLMKRLRSGIHGVGISNWSRVDSTHVHHNGIYFDLGVAAMAVWTDQYDTMTTDDMIRAVANTLYTLRWVGTPHRAEITHTVTRDVPFVWYLDGKEVDETETTVGCYVAELADGTQLRVKAQLGNTVGCMGVGRDQPESDWCDSYQPDRRINEPLFACDLVFDGEKTYYTYGLLSEKPIRSVRFEPSEAFRDDVEVRSIRIVS